MRYADRESASAWTGSANARPPGRPRNALAAGAVIEDDGGKDCSGNRPKPGAPDIRAYAGRGPR